MSKAEPTKSDAADWLIHQWVVAGVIASAARFVPIPFADDLIRSQCRRFIVSRTLAASGATLSTNELKPLYGGSGGCVAGCLGVMAKAPLKLLMFPIRKFVAIITSVRGVPLEITQSVLLGRTLHRLLARGDVRASEAETIRVAFEESFARMDFHAVDAAIADALHSIRHWKSSAIKSARLLSVAKSEVDEELPADEQVESAAATVQEALDRPKTLQLFEQFDSRFDAAFERLRTAAKPAY